MDRIISLDHTGRNAPLTNTLKTFLAKNARPQIGAIFEGLDRELTALLEAGVTQEFKKGEVIFHEGGIPAGVFILQKGFVKKHKFTSKGGEQIFYISEKGEFFGYHAILGEEHYVDSATTLTDAKIVFIPRESFLKIVDKSPALSLRLVKFLAREFSLYKNSIATLSTKSVKERLAISLLILDEKFRNPDHAHSPGEIILSRTDLANIVGTAKESLVRTLREFSVTGLVRLKGKVITIADREGLIRKASLFERKHS